MNNIINNRTIIIIIITFLNIPNTIFSQKLSIIPKPNYIKVTTGEFTITSKSKIYTLDKSIKTAELLQRYLVEEFGTQLDVIKSTKKKRGIYFSIDKKIKKEGYSINVNKRGIEISAAEENGFFYGLQTLKQIVYEKNEVTKSTSSISIPFLTIKDSPRFKWRAFMLDEARYFKGTKQVKKLLVEMAYLKMNVFHWHLVDDPGWRIEIKKYPKLTEIGSKRKTSQIGTWGSPKQSGEPHQGFYTQKEIKEIIKFASDRHITIIPEIEMPGHCSAAIVSYPWLGASDKKLEMPTTFERGKDIYNVADPRVYQFLTDVLDEVMELFPSNVIHIGGDEVVYDTWKESTAINNYIQQKELESYADLQIYFTNSISQYLHKKGRRMMGWNEIMGSNVHSYQKEKSSSKSQNLAKETIIHFWVGDIKLVNEAAEKGFEIVNSSHEDTYLDYGYNYIPLSRAYNFDPIPKNLDPKYNNKIIGLGCQMWSEWIPYVGQMDFQVFPRIAAFAETGWTNKENKNYEDFSLALDQLEKRWTKKEIYFAPRKHTKKK